MIGSVVSHYRVLEKLGEGGMGVVYKAEDIPLKRLAALKFLPPDMTRDPAAKERFVLEAQAASALNHAHVTTIYGIEESPEGAFIAMEYVDGKTLKEIIAGDLTTSTLYPMPISQVLDIAIQVAEGLAAAHEKGIVHRDIKADNIMLSVRGQAKIMDFGLAKLKGAEKLTQTRSTLGTLSYMSPEQAKGEEVDRRSDIFSLGVVLYEMLAGRLPFAGEYQAAVIYAIINETPQPVARYNSHVSAELERIVDKAMAKDREERYQHADDLLADLRRERKNLEYVKAGTVIPEKAVPKPKRKTLPLALAAASVAVLALLIFLFSPFKLRVGPAESAQAKENSLAVMYFENIQDPQDKNKSAQMITALLTTGLSDSPRYIQVVSSQRLFDILNLLGKGDLRVIDKSVATEVAKKAGVQWMVTGKILKEEPNIALISEISDAATGKILATQRVNAAAGEDLFAVVDKLSPQVMKALALPEQAQKELEHPISEATTRSQDAYRYYIEGVDNIQKMDITEALRCFKIALQIDPTFALAYYRLAYIYFRLADYKTAKEYITEALKRSDKMSRKEKLYAEAMAAAIERNCVRAIKTFREITVLYPEEKDAYFHQAHIFYYDLANATEAIRCIEKAIAIDPLFKLAYNMLAYACFETGDKEKSLWAINQYIALAPGEANPYDTRGELYAWNGQIDQAIASYEKALALNPNFFCRMIGILHVFKENYSQAEYYFKKLIASDNPSIRAEARLDLALVPLYQGKFAKALEIANEFMAVVRQKPDDPYEEGLYHYNKAWILEEKGDLRAAIQEATEGSKLRDALPLITGNWYLGYCAYLLSSNGRMAEAEAIVGSLKKESEKNQDFTPIYWQAAGVVALAKNDLQGAASCLEKEKAAAHDFFRIYHLARAYLQSGALDKAVALLEKALTRYDYPRFLEPILAVKAYYLLGQAYERSGWKDKAIQKYEKFLEIWKDADPGLPEVADARQRLEKLKKL